MFAKEDVLHPLGSRVRNTVAHELAHALGPRCETFAAGTEKSRKELVAIIERETERLSPALLIPPKAIEAMLKMNTGVLDVADLATTRDRLGVSSRVFVKRLELLAQDTESPLRHNTRLENMIMGSGEWINANSAELHPAPFKGPVGLLPEFVALLRINKKVAIADHFPDADFYLNGGSNAQSSGVIWLGTTAQPQSEKGRVEVTVETTQRKAGVSFLWVARRCDA